MKMKVAVTGYELAKARVIKGLSIDDLSKVTGLSTKTICDTENGKSIPTPRTIKKLCENLDIDPAKIIA